jgi:hypothetical protein
MAMQTYYLKRECPAHGSGVISQYSTSLLTAYGIVKDRLKRQSMACCTVSIITKAQYQAILDPDAAPPVARKLNKRLANA